MNEDRKDMLQEMMEISKEQFIEAEAGSKEQFNIAENFNKFYRCAVDDYKVETSAWHEEERIQNDLEIQKQRILADIGRYRKVNMDTVLKLLGTGAFMAGGLVYAQNGGVIPQFMMRVLNFPKF